MTKQERLFEFINTHSTFTTEEAIKAYVGKEQYEYFMGSIKNFQKRLAKKFEEKFKEKPPLDVAVAVKQRLRQNVRTVMSQLAKQEGITIYNTTTSRFKEGKYTTSLSEREEYVLAKEDCVKTLENLTKRFKKLRYQKNRNRFLPIAKIFHTLFDLVIKETPSGVEILAR